MCYNIIASLCPNFTLRQTENFAKPEQFVMANHGHSQHTVKFNAPVATPAYQGIGYGIRIKAGADFALMSKPLIENPFNVSNAPAQKVIANQYALLGPRYNITAIDDNT